MRLLLLAIVLVLVVAGCDTQTTAPITPTQDETPTAVQSVGDPTADDASRVPMQGPLLPGQERPTILIETGS